MAAVPGVAELLSRVGYRTISWSMATDDFHAHGRAGIEKLVQATHKHGMAVSEINVELDMVTLDADVRSATATFFKEVIQAVAEAGISTIKTYTGPIPWIPNALRIPDDITEGDAWVSVSSILQEVLPTAEQHNVSINIEAVFGYLCHDYYTLNSLFRLSLAHFQDLRRYIEADDESDGASLRTPWVK